jgi:glycosyltransferase involved in cell wall biosynthesis
MKILHWHNDLGLGGTPKTMEQFAIELQKRGHQNLVVCYEDAELYRRVNLENGNVRVLTIGREHRDLEFGVDIMSWTPDIVHSYRSGYSEFPEPENHFDLRGAKFVETNVFGHHDRNPYIDKTLYMSEYLQYHAGTFGKRYDFINNPIPIPIEDKVFIKRGEFPYHAFNDDRLIIGRTGRPENGIYDPISVEAINYLFSIRPDIRHKIRFLALAPPTNMIKDLQKYDICHTIVYSTIDEIEITRMYNSMHICAHARLDGETCGNAIQEAMMYGVPVVTHVSEPNNPDIYAFQAQCFLVEDQVTGFVVDHNVKSYAMALLKLIDNPSLLRSKMGDMGRAKALREFETGVCVDKLEKIYKEILNV